MQFANIIPYLFAEAEKIETEIIITVMIIRIMVTKKEKNIHIFSQCMTGNMEKKGVLIKIKTGIIMGIIVIILIKKRTERKEVIIN